MGPPGAGKGTQAEKVAAELDLEHISPGDLFRQAVKRGNQLGDEVKAYMERGELVPDDITINIILEKLASVKGKGGVILDGFPRNNNQAQALDTALKIQNSKIDSVIDIQVDQSELVRRLSSRWLCRECQAPYSIQFSGDDIEKRCPACDGVLYQRADDKPETVTRRLEVYFKETAPLIDYYRRQKKLVKIKGEGDPEVIKSRIVRALRKKSGSYNKI
jgi:adenylate kinase